MRAHRLYALGGKEERVFSANGGAVRGNERSHKNYMWSIR